jgi:hypothetical protein
LTAADNAASATLSVVAVTGGVDHIGSRRELAMTTQVLEFVELSERDRKQARLLAELGKDERIEVRVRGKSGDSQTVVLPPKAADLVRAAFRRLLQGQRVALLAEDQELSPNEAATVLGISRPLVVHRMDIGDLPFRYVGKHRRARLTDVLALKVKIDAQQAAMATLAEDAEDLKRDYGV